jgi:hypothetical protein
MLKFFRKKLIAKTIFWGLVVLILPAFVLWGTGNIGGGTGKGPRYVGIIDGRNVSFDEFLTGISAMRCLFLLNYFNQPKTLDAALRDMPLMAKLAWDRLIMLREARRYKIRVEDREVVAYIRSHPVFLRNGVFDEKLYGYILRNSMGLSPRSFEEMVRDNLKIQRLNEALTKDIKVDDKEALEEYKKEAAAGFDDERFKKEKDEFAKKLLARKQGRFLEEWFGRVSARDKVNINFAEVEKYYR